MNTWRIGRRRRAASAVLLLAALSGKGPARAQEPRSSAAGSEAAARAVEAYLREQMRSNHIPAVSGAVVRAGRTELLRAWGTANLECQVPATPGTVNQLASATKPLTGTALLLLVQEGRLALGESVRTCLPEAAPTWQPITIRHLATHASGISDDPGERAGGSAEEATRHLFAAPLAFEPGARSSYGIGGYAVLQHIIERTSGMPFADFLKQRLFDPLGVAHTRFDHATDQGPFREADVVPQRAGIYAVQGETQRISWFHYGSAAYTAGGLLASAEDLAKWAAALDGADLLAPAQRDRKLHGRGARAKAGALAIRAGPGRAHSLAAAVPAVITRRTARR